MMPLEDGEVDRHRVILTSLIENGSSAFDLRRAVSAIKSRMLSNIDFAEGLMSTMEHVSQLDMGIGEVELVLALNRQKGFGAPADAQKALLHIRKCVSLGYEEGIWYYAGWLSNPTGLDGHLDVNKDESLRLLRNLADFGNEPGAISLASHDAVALMIENRTSDECTDEELAAIDRYFNGTDWRNKLLYPLARFYTDNLVVPDYDAPPYRQARSLLIEGLEQPSDEGRLMCEQLLRDWDAMPEAPIPTTFSTLPIQDKVTLFAIPFVLIFWSLFGVALLVLVSYVSIAVGLVLFVLFAAFFIVKKSRDDGPPQ